MISSVRLLVRLSLSEHLNLKHTSHHDGPKLGVQWETFQHFLQNERLLSGDRNQTGRVFEHLAKGTQATSSRVGEYKGRAEKDRAEKNRLVDNAIHSGKFLLSGFGMLAIEVFRLDSLTPV